MAQPSRVLHFRNVAPDISEQDLQQLVQSFGTPERVIVLRSKNQALVQMADITSASNFVQFCSSSQPQLRGRPVYVQYSAHQQLDSQETSKDVNKAPPNRVLLVTIHNPLFPITVDVLHQVFSSHGFVEKIVIFQKPAGLQALVQFADIEAATVAKNTLQGRNIYDGCCTLDLQYSNLPSVQVNFNNDRTRSYVDSNLPEQPPRDAAPRNTPSPHPSNQLVSSLFGDASSLYGMQPSRSSVPHSPGRNLSGGLPSFQLPSHSFNMPGYNMNAQLPPGVSGNNDRCTLLVSGVNHEKVDANQLFNLLSNYGNVMCLKFLHNKPDHALVQMGEPVHAELAVTSLKGVALFGKNIDVTYSRHSSIISNAEAHDYSHSPYNRFTRNSRSYKHVCPPQRVLHCSNLPKDVTVENLTEHMSEFGTVEGCTLMDKGEKKQALVQYQTVEMATNSLVMKHTSEFREATIRLAFSKNVST